MSPSAKNEPNGISTPSAGRKLKVLMLHGYTQSGPLFHAKTRAHEKLLAKAFPPSRAASPLATLFPGGIQLFYPTAPIRLNPADIPGYTPRENEDGTAIEDTPEAYGWWRRETGGERYLGLEDGLQTIADGIRDAGGVDGVIGFSQGGCAAALVASLLEDGREEALGRYAATGKDAVGFGYLASFAALKKDLGQGPLRFAVSYSGFAAPASIYRGFYEPGIVTPFLHVLGSLDSVVEESRSQALVSGCVEGNKRVLYHPGGHFVPIGKEMSGALVGFIREFCQEKKPEEGVEDMDVPF